MRAPFFCEEITGENDGQCQAQQLFTALASDEGAVVGDGERPIRCAQEMVFGQTAGLVENGLECAFWNLTSIYRERELEVAAVSAGGNEQCLDVVTAPRLQRVP